MAADILGDLGDTVLVARLCCNVRSHAHAGMLPEPALRRGWFFGEHVQQRASQSARRKGLQQVVLDQMSTAAAVDQARAGRKTVEQVPVQQAPSRRGQR